MNNADFYYDENFRTELSKRIKKRELYASMVLACVLVLCTYIGAVAVYYVGAYAAMLFPFLSNGIYYDILDLSAYFLQMLLPIILYLLISKKKLSNIFTLKGEQGENLGDEKITGVRVALYTVIAFSLSQVVSYLSTYVSVFISLITSSFSKELVLSPEAFELPVPVTPFELDFDIFAVAIIPAILEELLFRGVLLSHFIKYGKTFAVVASAFFFASAHGSIEQMMYSFVYGLVFGYVAVKTGSLTVGIIMHFLNNAYSCVVEYLGTVFDTVLYWDIIGAINFCLIFIGLIAIVVGIIKSEAVYRGSRADADNSGELSAAEKFSGFTSPVMLIYYALILFETFYTYFSYNLTL